MSGSYIFKALIAIDMLASVLIFRDPDVTISALTGIELRKPNPKRWARILGWILNHLNANHTTNAIAHDIARANAALALLR